MESIVVTESALSEDNVLYMQNTLSELFSHAGCTTGYAVADDRVRLTVNCPEEFKEIVRAEVCDRAAEIAVVRYKYEFFKENLFITGLSAVEKEILFAGLIAADLPDDKRYAFKRYNEQEEIALDGVYNFRLPPLKKKWKDVADYMPKVFIGAQLKEFISYMLEDRKKRVYVSGDKVYDAHYRVLRRRAVLGRALHGSGRGRNDLRACGLLVLLCGRGLLGLASRCTGQGRGRTRGLVGHFIGQLDLCRGGADAEKTGLRRFENLHGHAVAVHAQLC